MDKNYYQEYYKLEREHWWFVVRAKIILERIKRFLPSSQKLNILNAGVATGRTSEVLSGLGEVTSVEYDENCRLFTVEKTGMDIAPGSILSLQYEDNSFDLSCAFDVIEHVDDDDKALAELIRVTKPNGLIYITVPAYQFLWSEHDIVNHHFRRYTRKSFRRLQRKTNTEVVFNTYFNSLLFIPIAFFRLFSRLIPPKWYRKGAGADNTLVSNDSFVNKLMYGIFDLERKYLRIGQFPFGVSYMVILKKVIK